MTHPPSEPGTSEPPILNPAPPAKNGSRILLVLLLGAITTGAALLLVYYLANSGGTLAMGSFVGGVLPVGAFLVGLAASTGYALGAWITGMRIQKLLLVLIIVFQVVGYFAAEYIGFRVRGPFVTEAGRVVGFGEYFHMTTMDLTFKRSREKADEAAVQLGSVGYLVRFAQLLGFAGGALIMPIALRTRPYCDLCERYMRSNLFCVIPMSSMDQDGDRVSQATSDEVIDAGRKTFDALQSAAVAGDLEAFLRASADLRPRVEQMRHRTLHLEVFMCHCPRCSQGLLRANLVHLEGAQGRNRKSIRHSETPLQSAFVQQFLAPPSAAARA